MPLQIPQPPSQAEMDEVHTVRDLQVRTNAVVYALQSIGGEMVSAEEVVIRASVIRDWIADGDIPAEMPLLSEHQHRLAKLVGDE